MRVLVTGAAGFIGSHLVDKLLARHHEVIGVDDFSGGTGCAAPIVEADCRNAQRMGHVFEQFKPQVVFHLAANAAENKAQFAPIDVTSRNYDAFIKTLTPAIRHGVKRFVFTSSIAVYGALQTPFKETDKPEPEDLYGISKLACEQSLKVLSKVHGFEYVIARPHNVYGPRQNMRDPYRNVVTIWMNALLQNMPIYIYGDGTQRRCFSYIDDVVDALYKCGFEDVAGETFNVGSDKDYSLNELAKHISSEAARPMQPVYLPERPQEVKVAIADHTRAKELLGYKDRTSLEEGISKTWEWVWGQGYQKPVYTELEIPSDKAPKNWRDR